MTWPPYSWRRPRHNADEVARRLERAAEAGDPGAASRLVQARLRSGTVGQLPLTVFVRAIQQDLSILDRVPGGVLGTLNELLQIRERTAPANWFPNHQDPRACPRGHRLNSTATSPRGRQERVDFGLDRTAGVSYRVTSASEDEVLLDWDPATEEGGPQTLWCSVCAAVWPWDGATEFEE